jgi:hypothetical protein
MREYLNDQEMAELEGSEDPTVQRLAAVIRSLSQELLLQRMRALGKQYLGDEQAVGLDIALWKTVVQSPQRLSDEEVAELEQLSQQAGGWWRLHPEAEFLDSGTWGVHYENALKPKL